MAIPLQLLAERYKGLYIPTAADDLYDNVQPNTPSSIDGEPAARATVGYPRFCFGCPLDEGSREMRIEIDVYTSVVCEAISDRRSHL
jgi:hypothetical protein